MGFLRRDKPRKGASPAAIEAAMAAVAAEPGDRTRAALHELLLTSTLVAVETERRADKSLALTMIDGPDGVVMPLFTEASRMTAWNGPGSTYVGVAGRELFRMAAAGALEDRRLSGAVVIELNPGSPDAYGLTKLEVDALARERMPAEPPVQASFAEFQAWAGRTLGRELTAAELEQLSPWFRESVLRTADAVKRTILSAANGA